MLCIAFTYAEIFFGRTIRVVRAWGDADGRPSGTVFVASVAILRGHRRNAVIHRCGETLAHLAALHFHCPCGSGRVVRSPAFHSPSCERTVADATGTGLAGPCSQSA